MVKKSLILALMLAFVVCAFAHAGKTQFTTTIRAYQLDPGDDDKFVLQDTKVIEGAYENGKDYDEVLITNVYMHYKEDYWTDYPILLKAVVSQTSWRGTLGADMPMYLSVTEFYEVDNDGNVQLVNQVWALKPPDEE